MQTIDLCAPAQAPKKPMRLVRRAGTMMPMSTPPPAAGSRLPWDRLPAHVQDAIEQRLGAPVVRATNQSGGFSPGVAARVTCADGSRAFVKAVGTELNDRSPDIHRAEARITAQLPRRAPVPRLRATYDDGVWVALIFDEIDGRMPAEPWRRDELDRVLTAVTELSRTLTPCPISGAPNARESIAKEFLHGYRQLLEQAPDDLDPWEQRHLPDLAELGEAALDHVDGNTLVHFDLRADNILLDGDRVWFVDWPWAFAGAPWIDSLMLVKNAVFHGHGPEPIVDRHPLLATVEPAVITGFVAGMAGFFALACRRPAPPGLPTLREFQRAQHRTTLAWLRRRLDWG